MNALQIKERFDYYTDNPSEAQAPSTKAHGVYVGILNKTAKGDANRKLVLKYLTGETSSKKMTDAQWGALKKMLDKSPVEVERFVGIILAEIVKQDGQMEFESAGVKRAAEHHEVMAEIENEN